MATWIYMKSFTYFIYADGNSAIRMRLKTRKGDFASKPSKWYERVLLTQRRQHTIEYERIYFNDETLFVCNLFEQLIKAWNTKNILTQPSISIFLAFGCVWKISPRISINILYLHTWPEIRLTWEEIAGDTRATESMCRHYHFWGEMKLTVVGEKVRKK